MRKEATTNPLDYKFKKSSKTTKRWINQHPQSARKEATTNPRDYKYRNSSKTTKEMIISTINDQRRIVNTKDARAHSSTTT